MAALHADGSPISLRQSLQQTWPALQLNRASAPSAVVAEDTAGEASIAKEQPTAESAEHQQEVESSVTINGVPASLDLPVAWLHARLHAADHFLYVIVRTRPGQEQGDTSIR